MVWNVQVLRSGVQVVISIGCGGGNSFLGRPPIVIPHGPKTPPNLSILNLILRLVIPNYIICMCACISRSLHL